MKINIRRAKQFYTLTNKEMETPEVELNILTRGLLWAGRYPQLGYKQIINIENPVYSEAY